MIFLSFAVKKFSFILSHFPPAAYPESCFHMPNLAFF